MRKDYSWLNKDSRTFLSRGYLPEGQTPEQRYRQIAETAEKYLGIEGFADKWENYLKRGYYSVSSPITSNFGAGRGWPISCNGGFVPDTLEGIVDKVAECAIMTKNGAGTSNFFGAVRHRGADITTGGKSSGSVHFMEWFEQTVNLVSQSNVRRGSFAAYLPIEHPDFEEFLNIRDPNHPIQKLSIGVTISDKWMKDAYNGDTKKRKLWKKLIKKRCATGHPYIFFTDNVNKNAPQVYKDKGYTIHASNLCAEIALSSSDRESFVCNLSSMNLLHYDEWKDTDAVETLTYFLDAVMSDYIEKTEGVKHMESAHRFAVNQRALGVGTLGWHSYLQSKNIAFESFEAKLLNTQVHRFIRDRTLAASKEMAIKYGEPELLKGYGLRNVTTMAIAPTTSSAFILGQVSQSIEPYESNYFTSNLAKGKFGFKNPFLKECLIGHEKNDSKTWGSILSHGGSVQHLEFLSDHERNVFKTFEEISQNEIIVQAAARQKYLDQSQSLNLQIPHDAHWTKISELYYKAWNLGVKTLYYQRSTSPTAKLAQDILTCKSCEA